MAYSVEGLQPEEKITLLNMVVERISDLEFDKEGESREKEDYIERSDTWRDDLAATTAALDSINTVLASLEEGTVREKMLKEQKRLSRRKEDLEERSERYSGIALIEKELELNMLSAQLKELSELKKLLEG